MKTEMEERICPKCGCVYTEVPALSRVDNETLICADCSTKRSPRKHRNFQGRTGKNYQYYSPQHLRIRQIQAATLPPTTVVFDPP